jgi:hypothetical protein
VKLVAGARERIAEVVEGLPPFDGRPIFRQGGIGNLLEKIGPPLAENPADGTTGNAFKSGTYVGVTVVFVGFPEPVRREIGDIPKPFLAREELRFRLSAPEIRRQQPCQHDGRRDVEDREGKRDLTDQVQAELDTVDD